MNTVTAPARPALAQLPRRKPARPVRLWALRAPISRRARAVLMVCSVLVPLVAWVAVAAAGVVSESFLPSPAAVLSAGWEMAQSGQLATDTWASVRRILIGFGLAIAVSVPLGLVMGSFQAGQALFEPIVGLLRYLPASAFIPLLTIWLGIGEPSKWMLLFIGTVFFNTLMTADAVRQVPRALIDVSYTLGARRGEVLRKVVVPHALPGMIDAVRVNAAAAWNFVVVAELINSQEGLGYRIARSQRFLASDRIFAVLIVIAVIGLAIDILLRVLRDRIGRWV
ncbi:ABC transporter permease [Actinoplanes sp. ATCC 53533]|uniref:ABC transporter permease n=1 Tax=Actinoplanes sp. ATCC 53533 TaxID=1288362 RepID=UPI000F7B0CE1|nr:ABC transporter permease [Actinoplanes sp. ATCC 53533]RSM58439.1 ABC transporter permease [Actinoplanes sp. ATCC 53533]